MSRTLEDLQKEYSQACMKLGDATYKIKCIDEERARMEQQATKLENQMVSLSKEAAKLNAKQNLEKLEEQAVALPDAGVEP